MIISAARRCASLGALAALLTACAALHPPPRATATLADHAPVVMGDAPAGGAWPGSQWWLEYDDPVLTALITTAIGSGRDIAVADARLHQAQEEVRVAATALGVQIGASAGYSRQRLSDNGMFPPEFLGYHWYDQADLGVSLRYQFDWWGKQRGGDRGSHRPLARGSGRAPDGHHRAGRRRCSNLFRLAGRQRAHRIAGTGHRAAGKHSADRAAPRRRAA